VYKNGKEEWPSWIGKGEFPDFKFLLIDKQLSIATSQTPARPLLFFTSQKSIAFFPG
jgi:hypothetical protein